MWNTPPTIASSGVTFSQLQSKGLAGTLEALITANSTATAAPTAAPTATATGGGTTGGSLAAGTYYLTFTETNGIGETTASPESTQLTVAAGNIPQVTFPALKTGNTARNLYLTPVNGATGTEVLYATNITTTTFNCSAAAPSGNSAQATPAAPTVNTTALSNAQITRIRKAEVHGQLYYNVLAAARACQNFLEGDPVDQGQILQVLCDCSVTFHAIAQAIDDVATLVAANPGHFNAVKNGQGDYPQRRTFP